MLVSFIIPCYNASEWITRCLDSIYALELLEEEFEVIAIDDASTDDTLKVLENYAQKHSNIQIIRHLVNRNLGAARNTGISIAKGEFITYIDSDDCVCSGISRAVLLAKAKGLDMVATRVQMVSETGVCLKEDYLSEPINRVFSGIEFYSEHPLWHTGVSGYVFSHNLLSTARYYFVEGAYYEDVDYLCRHLSKAEKMAYVDECGYKYFSNPDSITHSISPRHVFGYLFLGVRMLSLYEQLDNKTCSFADTVLEGGGYNIKTAVLKMFRLRTKQEIRMFYNLLDSHVDRKAYTHYKDPAYCWKWYVRMGLKHRHLTTMLVGAFVSLGLFSVIKRSLKRD